MNRYKELRTKSGMKQKEVAEKIEAAQTSVSAWENGTKRPELDKIIALSDLYDVSIDYLLEKTENPQRIKKPNIHMEEITAAELEIIRAYRLMRPDDRKYVRRILDLPTHPASTERTGIDRSKPSEKRAQPAR